MQSRHRLTLLAAAALAALPAAFAHDGGAHAETDSSTHWGQSDDAQALIVDLPALIRVHPR